MSFESDFTDEFVKKLADGKGVTARDGLLWQDGKMIDLPMADAIARQCGCLYAERLVKVLERAGQ